MCLCIDKWKFITNNWKDTFTKAIDLLFQQVECSSISLADIFMLTKVTASFQCTVEGRLEDISEAGFVMYLRPHDSTVGFLLLG